LNLWIVDRIPSWEFQAREDRDPDEEKGSPVKQAIKHRLRRLDLAPLKEAVILTGGRQG
jgi:hypothetical protein